MNRRGLLGLGLTFGLVFAAACGPKAATDSTGERGTTGAAETTPTPGAGTTGSATDPKTGKPVVLPSQRVAKAQEFFNNKVLPLVKAPPCTDCHAAPREVVLQQGGLKPQNFDSMFKLLSDGAGPNNNRLFNMMRGLAPHPGASQCTTETSPICAIIQEWYRDAYGEGVLSLGRVNDISPSSGTVSGWAGSSTAPTTIFKVRIFLDGESGKVPMLGETTANLEANDNNIDGAHGFAFKIPVANIDNRAHKLYVYAVDAAGKETAMAGSPYTYTAFKPKGSAAAQNFYNTIFNGCNGACHGFTYDTKWSSLVGGFGTAGWGAANNTLVNKFRSGQHGGPGFGANAVTASESWWREEFPEITP